MKGLMEQSEGLRVSIFDQVYHLKSDAADRAYMQEVARYVDHKMHSVAARTQSVDSFRVAVLAALHIADELFRLKHDHQRLKSGIETSSLRCEALLEEVLERPEPAVPGE
jgi:cell division protein ZapA